MLLFPCKPPVPVACKYYSDSCSFPESFLSGSSSHTNMLCDFHQIISPPLNFTPFVGAGRSGHVPKQTRATFMSHRHILLERGKEGENSSQDVRSLNKWVKLWLAQTLPDLLKALTGYL